MILKMRVFIAIKLPANIKDELRQIEADLGKCNLAVKWVDPQNMHLTLKFLGKVAEEKIEEIKKIIEDVAAQFNPFVVNFKEFGFFPNERRPRIFFISTDKEDKLKNISVVLEKRLEKIGFKPEFRFKSHITLARFKETKNIDCLKREVENITIEETFPVKEITLVKSTLTKSGPIYEEIFNAQMRQNKSDLKRLI
ncbi:MAG: RNA 2',3'-cyclic phosphodiesterase [Candidatus Omnitrophica bacterium]|nr:RNA 2',3'-cyclic phosphodiesterase [Candidatus Omnitrophota bacterium]